MHQPLRGLFLQLFGGVPPLRQKFSRVTRFAASVLQVASSDLVLEAGVLLFQVVLQILHVHEPDDRDAILLKNEILAVHVGATDHLPQIDSGFGERNAIYNPLRGFGRSIH
jgi:hypothetical protein